MSKYGQLKTWEEFQFQVLKNNYVSPDDASLVRMTDFIDKLLLEGGGIQDIHYEIKQEQDRRHSKGYQSKGELFNKNGMVQQRTLFGHIAHLIFNEKCMIKIDDLFIKRSTFQDTLDSKYSNNAFIRIEEFNGERRKD